jgi:dTDP-4-dehydrorhamnose reductase
MLLVTGSTGRLGRELVRVLPESLHPLRAQMDITNPDAVRDYVGHHKIDMVIHTAAMTGIRECEENKELAWKTNVVGTRNLLHACLRSDPNCYFVHISTACVFQGDRGDYTEEDVPYPKNFYSISKLVAESVVSESTAKNWLIIRTNFVAREKWPHPKAFKDRFGTYLFADNLAGAIKEIVEKRMSGILHVCGDKKISMLELARIVSPNVQPMTMDEYSGPPLTVDMSLRSVRIQPFRLTY